MGKQINLVLKGGVASGLVYAELLPRLAGSFRLHGLAGASAGAIAAALGAAAEYARQSGDVSGFVRLRTACETLPADLPRLFQATGAFGPLLKALMYLAPGSSRPRWGQALWTLRLPLFFLLLIGICAAERLTHGAGLSMAQVSDWLLAALIFLVFICLGAIVYVVALLQLLTRRHFGLCSGLGSGLGTAARPGVTDWLHTALQSVAGTPDILTFGDLKGRGVDLKIVATDLSRARTLMLPDTGLPLWFDPEEWRHLFPQEILETLRPDSTATRWPLPGPDKLPVVIAVRISLSCPGLMAQIPVYTGPEGGHKLYLSDGGIARNFPFDAFDGDANPCWGIDFDSLRDDDDDARRVWTLADEQSRRRTAADPLTGLFAFVWNLLFSMREADMRSRLFDETRSGRIVRIGLKRTEGGMNLHMNPTQIDRLSACGAAAADLIIEKENAR
ncbi:MAG: patatin-like phospholipase family protein [Asticcacaulis sp.]